jgi:hypothetical protein
MIARSIYAKDQLHNAADIGNGSRGSNGGDQGYYDPRGSDRHRRAAKIEFRETFIQ